MTDIELSFAGTDNTDTLQIASKEPIMTNKSNIPEYPTTAFTELKT